MADNYDHAKSILRNEIGDNIDFVLTDEEAADRPRGPAARDMGEGSD